MFSFFFVAQKDLSKTPLFVLLLSSSSFIDPSLVEEVDSMCSVVITDPSNSSSINITHTSSTGMSKKMMDFIETDLGAYSLSDYFHMSKSLFDPILTFWLLTSAYMSIWFEKVEADKTRTC